MDDRELEARLGRYLHQRFDAAPVPASLAAAMQQGIATDTQKVGFSFRPRAFQLGWAATLAVVLVAGSFLLYGNVISPAIPGATATPPAPSIPPAAGELERSFVVLPKDGLTPTKAESAEAAAIFERRLGALGLTNVTTAIGNGFELYAPGEGPSDDVIRAVLAATGAVEFVPLPPDILGDVDPQTLVGKPVPSGTTPLFGHDGIASVERGTSAPQGFPTVDIKFTPAATALFADYTANHTQEYLAIVIDGKVALAPVINEPIPGGEVSISGGGPSGPNPFRPDTTFDVAAAILLGGRLPAAWQGADVPVLITRTAAIEAARAHGGGGNAAIDAVDLDVLEDGLRWRAVWRIPFAGGAVVTVDAVTGEWLSTGIS
jgi:hypothetical protein